MEKEKDLNKEQIKPIVEHIKTLFPGDAIKHTLIQAMAKMKEPVIDENTMDEAFKIEYANFQIAYLKLTSLLKETLLKEHNICLKSVSGYGYKILTPLEQLEYGIHLAKTGVQSQIRKAQLIVTYIDISGIPSTYRAKQVNSLAAWAMVLAMMKGRY
jgi:hypothetical protein